MTTRFGALVGGRVLTPEGWASSVSWSGGLIAGVDGATGTDEPGVQHVDDQLVLPGIIDIHGDAFERCVAPRPGSMFPVVSALLENDAQLLSAGITTFLLSATDSWEPGLRSRATLREVRARLDDLPLAVDTQLHVRHEQCQVEGHDELMGWLDDGSIAMLSLNDHTPDSREPERLDRAVASLQRRFPAADTEVRSIIETAVTAREQGAAQVVELVARARARSVPVASHDRATLDDLEHDLALGVSIAEFPFTLDLARRYQEVGVVVLMGAPNLVRGRSHLGLVSVRDAVESGVVDVLASDYHYSSLLLSPFVLVALGLSRLEDAWPLVSAHPASAAGLGDRGSIEPGRRADLIVVDDRGAAPIVTGVVVGGRAVAGRFEPR
ncbi:MAG: alpha-D-ribose 1-methylphosphonate 5-triphosphate diphosphatase [Actinomycetia bacterium]|nr:alpha-D-ribose 1-methylphosphonate 5-triphosphate diphosphatase [Actinomycetes bacterium]